MSTRVYLLRHAESSDPTVFHGAESDVGLSERGQQQARAVAATLAGYRPEVLVSSGMRRALETAAAIAEACALQVRVELDLHERRVGSLCGQPFLGPNGIWPETLRRWMAGEIDYAPAGAESFADIRARVLPVWDRLVHEFNEQTLVVVAHGVVCKVLIVSLLEGLDVSHWQSLGPIRNVAITELVREQGESGWQAVRLNDSGGAAE